MNEQLECSPTLKHRLKHTICGCFKHYPNHYDHLSDESPTSNHRQNNSHLTRTSSGGGSGSMTTLRSSRSEEFNLKGKCKTLISRMGTTTPRGHQHRKSHSTDFRYDPHSYSLNFDDDASYVDDFPFRNFSARLPPSPLRAPRLSGLAPPRSISDGALADQVPSSDADTPIHVTALPPREITAFN